MKVLLSIKPKFIEEIYSGKKKYEYRKKIFKNNDITSVVVYATKPLGKIVGEFVIDDIIVSKPNEIWELTKNYSGISHDFFSTYFANKTIGYAIKIKEFKKYDTNLSLDHIGIKKAPQSFMYISESQINDALNNN